MSTIKIRVKVENPKLKIESYTANPKINITYDINPDIDLDDNIIYYTTNDNKIIDISNDNIAFNTYNDIGKIIFKRPITTIAKNLFRDKFTLTSVILPESIKIIEEGAFCSCFSLTEINIPNGVTSIGIDAFDSCAALKHIVIPDSVTSIGSGAFANCGRLISINIPNSVTEIGTRAFLDTTGELIIDNNTIVSQPYTATSKPILDPNNWFYGSKFTKLTISDIVTKIGSYMFSNCNSLTSVSIGKNVTSIGSYAFNNVTGTLYIDSNTITSINYQSWYDRPTTGNGWLSNAMFSKLIFGENIESIGNYTFVSWDTIKEIDFSRAVNLHTIGEDVFGASSITSLNIPRNVESIGNIAFRNCTLLETLTFQDNSSLSKIGDSAFINCFKLNNVIIPDSVTNIGGLSFRGCYSLENISFGKSITEIPFSSFSILGEQLGRDVKAHINIGSNVKKIADFAFEGRRLDSLVIPKNVETIEYSAFAATSISNLWFVGKVDNLGSLTGKIDTIHVPNEYLNYYKTILSNYNVVGYEFTDEHIKTMSFNMSVDKTPTRIDACVEMLKDQNADIIGLQETMYHSTWNKVYNALKEEDYEGFSVIRMNNPNPKFEEGTSILYNTNKFILTFQHNFWLSNPSTPPYPTLEEEKEKEPNRTWFGAQYRRVANLAIFYVKNTNKTICYINTHLDTRPNSAEPNKYPRPEEMELIMQKFKEYGSGCDYWILTGDMNAEDGKERTLNIAYREGFANSRTSAYITDSKNTFNGFGNGGGIIDHILCSKNISVQEYKTIVDTYNGITYISDHYPIIAQINLN